MVLTPKKRSADALHIFHPIVAAVGPAVYLVVAVQWEEPAALGAAALLPAEDLHAARVVDLSMQPVDAVAATCF